VSAAGQGAETERDERQGNPGESCNDGLSKAHPEREDESAEDNCGNG